MIEEGPYMADQGERIRALEIHRETQASIIAQHSQEIQLLTRWVNAAEERNRIMQHTHADKHEDRWQIWLRWAIPGIPAGIILALYLQLTGGAG